MGTRVTGWAGTTARKVAATVGTVSAWAAVTALGTWGTFPGSLAEASTAGYVSLGLDGPAGVPLEFSGLVPGGALTQGVTLMNDGDADLSAVTLSTVVVASSLLDTDRTHGLHLSVSSCSRAWRDEWTCPGDRDLLLEPGPVVRQVELLETGSRTAGAIDHLAVTVALPATAGDEFSGLRSELVLTFTGVQRARNR